MKASSQAQNTTIWLSVTAAAAANFTGGVLTSDIQKPSGVLLILVLKMVTLSTFTLKPSYQMLCAHCLQRVVSLGRLTAQHDTVVAIQHSIGNITGLSASRARLLGHAFKHLNVNKETDCIISRLQKSTYLDSTNLCSHHRPVWHRRLACQSCCICRSSFSGRWRPSRLGFQFPDLHGPPWCHH